MTNLRSLRQDALEANLELARRGLVAYTFGNASSILRPEGLVAIKPSGVPYDRLKLEDLIITDLHGRTVEGALNPSSDLATHLALYRAFPAIGGVAHTHSRRATAWAQAGREIPCLGTTHADYFHGPVPLTEPLSPEEIQGDYEANTGLAIVRRFQGLDPAAMPAVLVAAHGPFTWGATAVEAARNSVLLEEVAALALETLLLGGPVSPLSNQLLDKHFFRKHGPGAYYGQR